MGARRHARIRQIDHVRNEGVEEPTPDRISFLVLELPAHGAQLLAQFDAKPDRIVPENLAGTAFHHLCAHVERGEQGIEGRSRGVLQEALVEAPMLHTPPLFLDVPVPDMDLRGLREARKLFVGRLCSKNPGAVFAEVAQPHGETANVERMELHEPRPGLVEQDIIAKVPDGGDDMLRMVDCAVIGTLLDDGDTEGARPLPGLLVGHKRIVANGGADRVFLQPRRVNGTDQAEGVPVGGEIDRNTAAHQQSTVMGRLVVVAVEQDEIAFGDERGECDLVGRRRAVEHEIGLFCAEDGRSFFLGAQRRAFVGEKIAEIEDRIVEIVAENRLPEMFHEDAADRAAAVENAAIVAGTGPELVALLCIVGQSPEERGLQCLRILLQAADQVLGDELGRFLGKEDIAVDKIEHLNRNVLEALAAHEQDDRQFQSASTHELDQRRGLAFKPLLSPVDDHAADGCIGLDRDLRVLEPPRLHDLEARLLDRGDNLLYSERLQILRLENRD